MPAYSHDLALEDDDGLNDETFGDADLDIPFDFAASTSRFTSSDPLFSEKLASSKQDLQTALDDWNDLDLDLDPLLASDSYVMQAPPKAAVSAAAPTSRAKTLEEIEAELLGTAPPQAKSLAEIEAELLGQQQLPQAYPAYQGVSGGPGMPGLPGITGRAAYPAGGAIPVSVSAAPQRSVPPGHFIPPTIAGMPPPPAFPSAYPPAFPYAPPGGLPPFSGPPGGYAAVAPVAPVAQQAQQVQAQAQAQAQAQVQAQAQPPLRAFPAQDATQFPPLGQGRAPTSSRKQQAAAQRGPGGSAGPLPAEAPLPMQISQLSLGGPQGHPHPPPPGSHPHPGDSLRSPPSPSMLARIEQKIEQQEAAERKRAKRAAKIASFAKYNNLMSHSDKDFISRIQLSQLVIDDPAMDDFYFYIMQSARSKPAPLAPEQQSNKRISKSEERHIQRRDAAMNKMIQNVQRLVDRAKEKSAHSSTLEGALGKVNARTRSAPRQLLQVARDAPESAAADATRAPTSIHSVILANLITTKKPGRATTAGAGGPLSRREALVLVERVYDTVLDLEQLRRAQPGLGPGPAPVPSDADSSAAAAKYAELAAKLWDELQVLEPLEEHVTHPFVALLDLNKGKSVLPRAIRHLSPEQSLTVVTLIVATFDTLACVRTGEPADVQAFLDSVVPVLLVVINRLPLHMVTGMLGLLLERTAIVAVAQSKPGTAVLTLLLSRAESLRQETANAPEDLAQWAATFSALFNALSPFLLELFPSVRHPGVPEAEDEPVWRLLAALAVCADAEQQQVLVTGARDKVLDNAAALNAVDMAPEERDEKVKNVNLLLHSIALDASQLV